MSNAPFFSVITPSYNREHLLKKTIESVLNQSFTDWEYIIVDDGSTDNTRELVHAYKDPRIRYVYQQNSERSAARNNGIALAKGKFICFVDSDDSYLPDHLQSFYDEIKLQQEAPGFYYTGIIEHEESGKEISHSEWYDSKYRHPMYFAWQKLPGSCAACLSRELLLENKFPEQFNIFEDGHVWLRILSKYPFFQIKKHTVMVLEHHDRSINSVFENTSIDQSVMYINCINDLFNNYAETLAPFITSEMKDEFIRKKLLLISSIGIAKGGATRVNGRSLLQHLFRMQPQIVLNPQAIKLYIKSFF